MKELTVLLMKQCEYYSQFKSALIKNTKPVELNIVQFLPPLVMEIMLSAGDEVTINKHFLKHLNLPYSHMQLIFSVVSEYCSALNEPLFEAVSGDDLYPTVKNVKSAEMMAGVKSFDVGVMKYMSVPSLESWTEQESDQ